MDNITHSLFAVTLAQTPLGRAGTGTTAALLIASNAPDVDIVAAFTQGGVGYLAAHRGPTHGPLGWLCLGIATAALVRMFSRQARFGRLLPVSILAVTLHGLMDLANPYGTRLLSPFDWSWYALDWLPIVDPYLLAALLTGMILMSIRSTARPRIAAVLLMIMAGDYTLRAAAHQRALEQATEGMQGSLAPCPPVSLARWSGRVIPSDGDQPPCVVASALPLFTSPFEWRAVRQWPDGSELFDLDLRRGRRGAAVWFPNQQSLWIQRASRATTARVFLAFARLPSVRVFSRDGQVVVQWSDLRFLGGLTQPADRRVAGLFVATVRLDRQGRIIRENLGQ